MSAGDCVSSPCRTSIFGHANLLGGFGTRTNNRPLLINVPLSQAPQSVRLQVAGTLLSDLSRKSRFAGACFKALSNRANAGCRIPHLVKFGRNADEFEIFRELRLKEKEQKRQIRQFRQFGNSRRKIQKQEESADDSAAEYGIREKSGEDSSSSDFIEEFGISEKSGKNSVRKPKEDNLVGIEEGLEGENAVPVVGRRSGRQMMKRSNIIAKQVISIQSALSLGFVSQLWVDTSAWLVLVVEVRPKLLSGELERCLLEDISKVGDVLLVEDEHVMANDFKLVGLETLVGYTVVTPGRRNIGKVRGYTFNINSGAVESLELDSFGISIIPSSLVSTYALFVEDVVEVLPDTIVVHEAAASRIQRLTKGFLGTQNMGDFVGEFKEYSDRGGHDDAQSSYRRSKSRKFHQKMVESSDEWELPMDYL